MCLRLPSPCLCHRAFQGLSWAESVSRHPTGTQKPASFITLLTVLLFKPLAKLHFLPRWGSEQRPSPGARNVLRPKHFGFSGTPLGSDVMMLHQPRHKHRTPAAGRVGRLCGGHVRDAVLAAAQCWPREVTTGEAAAASIAGVTDGRAVESSNSQPPSR